MWLDCKQRKGVRRGPRKWDLLQSITRCGWLAPRLPTGAQPSRVNLQGLSRSPKLTGSSLGLEVHVWEWNELLVFPWAPPPILIVAQLRIVRHLLQGRLLAVPHACGVTITALGQEKGERATPHSLTPPPHSKNQDPEGGLVTKAPAL